MPVLDRSRSEGDQRPGARTRSAPRLVRRATRTKSRRRWRRLRAFSVKAQEDAARRLRYRPARPPRGSTWPRRAAAGGWRHSTRCMPAALAVSMATTRLVPVMLLRAPPHRRSRFPRVGGAHGARSSASDAAPLAEEVENDGTGARTGAGEARVAPQRPPRADENPRLDGRGRTSGRLRETRDTSGLILFNFFQSCMQLRRRPRAWLSFP